MSEINSSDAYKPPRADLTEPGAAARKLYSPGQVAGAALLGTPMAACWLMARNFAVLGNLAASRQALIGGVLGTVAVLGIAYLLPAKVPNSVLPVAYAFGLREIARKLQGAAFAAHLAAGGQKQSSWHVVGIGLIGLAAIFGALVVTQFLRAEAPAP